MEMIRSWLVEVTCAAMTAALAESLMPKGPVKQVGRLVCGLMLLWVVLGPAVSISGVNLVRAAEDLNGQIDERKSALQEQNDSLLKSLIEQESAAYIVDKAKQAGSECQVEVRCAADENGTWTPWSVHITGVFSKKQRESLEQLIADELGIPISRQTYAGGDGS